MDDGDQYFFKKIIQKSLECYMSNFDGLMKNNFKTMLPL